MPVETASLDYCIEDVKLRIEYLSLQRQILKTKSESEKYRENYAIIESRYKDRLKYSSMKLQRLLHQKYLQDYINAVKDMYYHTPPRYVIRKHAELLRCMRNQALFETYMTVMKVQHQELVECMEELLSGLQTDLKEQKMKLFSIRQELIRIITKKLKLYNGGFKQKNERKRKSDVTLQRSVVRRLMFRRAISDASR